ncbi:MAG TPA: thioredoxin-dependent thiol peroxidase [Trueperaceae bacterium]
MDRLEAGDKAPDFTLDSDQGPVTLQQYQGDWVVLYFYPKDFTSGCTQEACDFRDALANREMAATVLGVSPDPVESHAHFKEEHGLTFPLLADEDHKVAEAYGAYGTKNLYGKKIEGVIRSTFLIAPDGTIREPFYNVKAGGHAQRVAAALREAQA